MARTLELALNRVFRSRWGIAVVLALLVLAVVGIGRLFNGAAAEPPLTSGSPAPAISADPKDDDTVITAEPPPAVTSPRRGAARGGRLRVRLRLGGPPEVHRRTWHDGCCRTPPRRSPISWTASIRPAFRLTG
jgi:hypothetical protein